MIKIDNKQPKGEIFNIFFNNRLAKTLLNTMKTKMDGVIFLRFARTGFIGQTILDECFRDYDGLGIGYQDTIASLSELYIFYIRSIYDYLLFFLKKKLQTNLPNSYNKFVEKVKSGAYPELSDQLSSLIKKEIIPFRELRNLRNSIKNQASTVSIDLKEKKLYIHAKFFSQTKGPHSTIDEELSSFILRHSFNLWILMMMIYMEVEGKTWLTLRST